MIYHFKKVDIVSTQKYTNKQAYQLARHINEQVTLKIQN